MSVWVAGISAAVTVGAALYTSNQQKQAAKGAANAQINAANQASSTQQGLFNQQTALQAPWRTPGANSMGYLSYLMGVPGSENWKPGYFNAPDPNAPAAGAATTSSSKKGGWSPTTGFGDKLWSTGGILGGADGGLGQIFGFSAPPKGSGADGATSSTGPMQQKMRPSGGKDLITAYGGSSSEVPTFSTPYDPGFQNLPSGAMFMGPDGVMRRKH